MGPFAYTLSPAVAATLDVRLDTDISQTNEVDLYSFTGEAGRTVSITAYWGYELASQYLRSYGRFRLIDPDGVVLASPGNQQVNSYHRSSYLHDYKLAEDGTYFVEVSVTNRGTGRYWLGISDPLATYAPLSTTEPTGSSFGVQGDRQDYSFTATAGEATLH